MNILAQLEPQIVTVRVRLPYGTPLEIKIYTLTLAEWDELGEAIDDPLAPFKYHNSRGEEVRDFYDPKYLKARRAAETNRAYRRLTMGLVRAGNEIPGILFEDKVKEVKARMDLSLATTLMRWQSELITLGQVAVMTAADQFPAVETTIDAGTESSGTVPEAVAGIDVAGTE